jgi:putative oxidoreductase
VQRLFSTFANGWPGLGLLIQRVLTALLLIRFGIGEASGGSDSPVAIVQTIAAFLGILFLIGLWTPVVGALIAVLEVWIAMSTVGLWIPLLLATFGATIAMIGPGAWSIDARLFGRKHLETQ